MSDPIPIYTEGEIYQALRRFMPGDAQKIDNILDMIRANRALSDAEREASR